MRNFGLDWPENLECSKFPEAGGEELCVSQNTSATRSTGDGDAASAAAGGVSSSGVVGSGSAGGGATMHGPKVISTRKNGGGGGGGKELSSGMHRNIRFVCPVQLKTPSPMGYSLTVGGEVSVCCCARCAGSEGVWGS